MWISSHACTLILSTQKSKVMDKSFGLLFYLKNPRATLKGLFRCTYASPWTEFLLNFPPNAKPILRCGILWADGSREKPMQPGNWTRIWMPYREKSLRPNASSWNSMGTSPQKRSRICWPEGSRIKKVYAPGGFPPPQQADAVPGRPRVRSRYR